MLRNYEPELIGVNHSFSKSVIFGKNVTIYGNVTIADKTVIGHNVIIYPDTVIGKSCNINDNSIIGRVPKARKESRNLIDDNILGTNIGDSSTIGSSSIIYKGVKIGKSCFIADNVWIRESCSLSNKVVIGTGTQLMNKVSVGSETRIMNGSHITEFVKIGSRVFIGPNVTTLASNNFSRDEGDYKPKPILIESLVRIGGNSTILPGIKIGEESLVAAGSVVLNNVDSHLSVFGNPAKVFRKVRKDERLN